MFMLASEYKRVSAIRGIVFTCFLLSSTSLFALSAAAQSTGVQSRNTNGENQEYASNHLRTQSNSKSVSHANLENDVYTFIEQSLLNEADSNDNIQIQVREIDSRINIPFCDTPFSFDTSSKPKHQSNMSIKVSCSNTNWYLFMHATVAIIQKVVVSKENLSPGTLLSHRNIEVVDVNKNKLRGSTFTSVDEVLGARIKRRTRSGNIINDRMLCFICKGDRVTIAALSGGLSIKVYGVAEEDGVLGDTIQVRNISSDKLVFAKIASTSQVEINI